MATELPTTVETVPNKKPDLQEFAKLGEHVYLHIPTTVSNTSDSSPSQPDLIILCTWMGAAEKPIAKYVHGAMSLFPDASILLIRSTLQDIVVHRTATQVKTLIPAAKAIRELVDKAGERGKILKVFLYIFSNGGSWSATVLDQAYNKVSADSLPISAMVSDSAPSLPHARLGFNAMITVFPENRLVRFFAGGLIWFIIGLAYVGESLGVQKSFILELWKRLNDPTGPFINQHAPRTYIVSKADNMVPIQDVERHAREARSALKTLGVDGAEDRVTVEEFTGSNHVGHMRVDAERYWNIIKATWLKSGV